MILDPKRAAAFYGEFRPTIERLTRLRKDVLAHHLTFLHKLGEEAVPLAPLEEEEGETGAPAASSADSVFMPTTHIEYPRAVKAYQLLQRPLQRTARALKEEIDALQEIQSFRRLSISIPFRVVIDILTFFDIAVDGHLKKLRKFISAEVTKEFASRKWGPLDLDPTARGKDRRRAEKARKRQKRAERAAEVDRRVRRSISFMFFGRFVFDRTRKVFQVFQYASFSDPSSFRRLVGAIPRQFRGLIVPYRQYFHGVVDPDELLQQVAWTKRCTVLEKLEIHSALIPHLPVAAPLKPGDSYDSRHHREVPGVHCVTSLEVSFRRGSPPTPAPFMEKLSARFPLLTYLKLEEFPSPDSAIAASSEAHRLAEVELGKLFPRLVTLEVSGWVPRCFSFAGMSSLRRLSLNSCNNSGRGAGERVSLLSDVQYWELAELALLKLEVVAYSYYEDQGLTRVLCGNAFGPCLFAHRHVQNLQIQVEDVWWEGMKDLVDVKDDGGVIPKFPSRVVSLDVTDIPVSVFFTRLVPMFRHSLRVLRLATKSPDDSVEGWSGLNEFTELERLSLSKPWISEEDRVVHASVPISERPSFTIRLPKLRSLSATHFSKLIVLLGQESTKELRRVTLSGTVVSPALLSTLGECPRLCEVEGDLRTLSAKVFSLPFVTSFEISLDDLKGVEAVLAKAVFPDPSGLRKLSLSSYYGKEQEIVPASFVAQLKKMKKLENLQLPAECEGSMVALSTAMSHVPELHVAGSYSSAAKDTIEATRLLMHAPAGPFRSILPPRMLDQVRDLLAEVAEQTKLEGLQQAVRTVSRGFKEVSRHAFFLSLPSWFVKELLRNWIVVEMINTSVHDSSVSPKLFYGYFKPSPSQPRDIFQVFGCGTFASPLRGLPLRMCHVVSRTYRILSEVPGASPPAGGATSVASVVLRHLGRGGKHKAAPSSVIPWEGHSFTGVLRLQLEFFDPELALRTLKQFEAVDLEVMELVHCYVGAEVARFILASRWRSTLKFLRITQRGVEGLEQLKEISGKVEIVEFVRGTKKGKKKD